jgi:hypothetical protein
VVRSAVYFRTNLKNSEKIRDILENVGFIRPPLPPLKTGPGKSPRIGTINNIYNMIKGKRKTKSILVWILLEPELKNLWSGNVLHQYLLRDFDSLLKNVRYRYGNC